MPDDLPAYRMDKTAFGVINMADQEADSKFWCSQTPHERLRALEFLRQVMYGYDPVATRLQRVLAIAEHPSIG
jgi:hypothetical protein